MINFGFSSIAGFCVGATAKQLGRQAVVYLGFSVLVMGVLSHYGYATVDQEKIEKDMIALLDMNGDGKLTIEDFEVLREKGLDLFKHEVPMAATFTGGVMAGWVFA